MSTSSNDEDGLDRRVGDISKRKARHLEICVEEGTYSVETQETLFSRVRFLHRSLPELDTAKITTDMSFLGHDIALPLLISCMTGGSAEGSLVNKRLAQAANRAGIPVGTGSIRILFRDESYFEQFHMKAFAPDVPVIANLSAVQLREIDHPRISEVLKRLEVQALAIHLNAGHELFQSDGDRDFRGLKDAIRRYCAVSPLPIIVKETGFGIRPSEVEFLLDAGASYVDLAGAGGTNWVRVESYRGSSPMAEVAREFDDWGIPTALLLGALAERNSEQHKGKIIASGGLRTGSELAKAIALGAALGAMALPFARAVYSGGVEGALELIERVREGLRSAMLLTGAQTLDDLRKQRLLLAPDFEASIRALNSADTERTATGNA